MESCVLAVLFPGITGSISSVVKDLLVDVFGPDSLQLFAAFQSQLIFSHLQHPLFPWVLAIACLKPDNMDNSHGQTLSRNIND